MPPIRRYLRITRHSVLEVRIYLDNPADGPRWLLRPRDPALPNVIRAVQPLVLPKLREENALQTGRGGGGGGKGGGGGGGKGRGKRKGWKDVVVQDDFEVSIFLTETSSRHSILRKEKRAKTEEPIDTIGATNGGKMTGTEDVPVEIVVEEEEEEGGRVRLGDVPLATTATTGDGGDEEGDLFVSNNSSEDGRGDATSSTPTTKDGKRKRDEDTDEKKKMMLDTTYDGFSIYGRILCLVVKRKGGVKGKDNTGVGAGKGGAMMEEWIASTQVEGGMMDE